MTLGDDLLRLCLMSKKRLALHLSGFALIAAGLVAALPVIFKPATTQASACSVTYGFMMIAPTPNQTLQGVVPLMAQGSSPATNMTFRLVATSGSAQITVGALVVDPMHWRADWPSTALSDGNYQVTATGLFPTTSGGSNTGTSCQTDPVVVTIHNQTSPTNTLQGITLHATPVSWSGPTNYHVQMQVKVTAVVAGGASTDATSAASVQWSTTLGTIGGTGTGPAMDYFSGPLAGSGQVMVKATFQGLSATLSIPVQVTATGETPSPTGPSATPTAPVPGPPSSGGSSTPGGTTPLPITPIPAGWVEQQAADCIKAKLGTTVWEAVKSGRQGMTLEQRLLIADCFASNKSIPSSFAPVDPGTVKALPVALTADLGTVQVKRSKTADGKNGSKEVIELSGKAAPNEEVYVWIYSEPMVLKAKADGNGDWKYTLENPLEPGKHEIYVTKQATDKTFVRSQPAFISVAKAASSEQNPQGNSLTLLQDANTQLWAFILVGVLLVLAAAGTIIRVRHLRLLTPAMPISSSSQGLGLTLPSTPAPTDAAPGTPPPNPPTGCV